VAARMAAHSRRTRWLQRPPPNGKKAGFTAGGVISEWCDSEEHVAPLTAE